jgi:hypothetical protein
VILVLFGVNTEALSHEFYIDAVDVLDKSGDWRQNLLGDVPVHI